VVVLCAVFGRDNPDASLYMVMLGGVSLLVAAALVTRVRDVGDPDVPDEAVIEADEHEPLTVQGSVQPVPGSGLIDR
jgi:maltose/moltooligosaccharide transporter